MKKYIIRYAFFVTLMCVLVSATKESDPNPFGVTRIVRWRSESAHDYVIKQYQTNQNFILHAGEMLEGHGATYEFDIPWCSRPHDVSLGHFIQLYAVNVPSVPIWYIWQNDQGNDDKVRAGEKLSFPAARINGYSDVNGDRHLIIKADGSIEMIKP